MNICFADPSLLHRQNRQVLSPNDLSVKVLKHFFPLSIDRQFKTETSFIYGFLLDFVKNVSIPKTEP